MLQRACKGLENINNIVVINDEAHHCYREKPQGEKETELKGEEKDEAKKNDKAARLWIYGLEVLKRNNGVRAVDAFRHAFFSEWLWLRRGHPISVDRQ